MLELKRSVVKIKIDDTVYELKKPTLNMIIDYEKKMKQEGCDHIEESKSLLAAVGLPKEVSGELEIEHLDAIIDALSPKKKKSLTPR